MWNLFKKLAVGLVVGGGLAAIANSQEVPVSFQLLFFIIALVGAVVFALLDAKTLNVMNGGMSFFAVTVFWVFLISVCVAGASFLPQFDPEDEKAKIGKLLDKERKQSAQGKTEELIARAKALDQQVKALEDRLKGIGGGQAVAMTQAPSATEKPAASGGGGAGDIMKVGEEQWQLQECYNCHKLRGEGGKKRGPELDNIGTLLTVEEIQQKIADPKSFMAEGYDKEWQKGIMPDKFKDLMDPKEMLALATWLGSFKNVAVNTPKPIKKK
ncbi:MAG: cytochrome c [Nitrospira sp.]|nr:cytochrome c [Nitrospira sp.]MDH4302886.1 cytochrome c [Nitrospira sp.]MDH5192176.1 cytochrome c [Nitrospira sp.]